MRSAPVGHHCPTCVDEARKEFRQGPGRRIAIANAKATSVTAVILVAIGAVYLLEVFKGGAGSLLNGPNTLVLVKMGASVGLFPVSNTEIVGIALGQTWRLFTAMFLHAGLLHLAFNAYALWIFGTVVEQEIGRVRFALVYFLTGLAASAASYAFAPEVFIPGVGASGAVFGVFGALVAFNWKRRHTALGAARLRSAIFILLINTFIALSSGGAIDWRAHLGGFVAGLLMGVAAEDWTFITRSGRPSAQRLTFAVGAIAVAAVTVALVVWRTAEIKQLFPQVF
jgi:membrane associated rhomboid family serine protease